ncbi:MAG: MFS transporter [Kordiimonas sp.]|nr:MFS transporter [Kordiimonas sp.]
MKNQYHLLATKRFLPLFLTQFLGAFNDNIFKNALVIMITIRLGGLTNSPAPLLITLAAGLFILPFFLFSSTAGQWADKYDKSMLIRHIKTAEIIIMAIGMVGFITINIPLLMGVLFLMGSQSAFFGPLKYAILPDHLSQDELLAGNALVETATFIAILCGTITGGIFIMGANGPAKVAMFTLGLAVLGRLISSTIPSAPAVQPELKINYRLFSQTWSSMVYFAHDRYLFRTMIAVSWFWFIGASILSQLPTYGQRVLLGDELVITFLLTAFSVGIGCGSLLCNTVLKGRISLRMLSIAALGMSLFLLDLYWLNNTPAPTNQHAIDYSFSTFLTQWAHIRVLFDLTALAICGGVYIVPLYAVIQQRAPADHRARAIANLNVLNALFMVISALLMMGLLSLKLTIPEIFLTLAIMNIMLLPWFHKLSKNA